MKGFLHFLLSFLAILLLGTAALALDLFKRHNLVLPRTLFGDTVLSGMTRSEARDIITEKMKTFSEKSFQLAARGIAKPVTLEELHIALNPSPVLADVPFSASISNAKLIIMSIAGQRIIPAPPISRGDLLRVIDEKFPEISKAKNAHFKLTGGRLSLVEAKTGVTPSVDLLLQQLKNDIAFLETGPLFVEFKESAPTVFAADLEKYKEEISAHALRTIKLFYEKDSFAVDFSKHPEWLVFEKKPYEVSDGELPFSIQWDSVAFANFLNEAVAKKLEQAPDDIRMRLGDNGKAEFEGHGSEGRAIDRERLLVLVNNVIAEPPPAEASSEVEIPLEVVEPKIEVSEDLQRIGIRELVAVGYTRFEGSPMNRKHNIGVGVAHFNGTIIPQGGTFSFDANLGPVDDTTGYKKELVIKPEGTIPEFGGGLCQVSTTMYRAAIYGGLPIVERAPHSYAVTYYSQVGGHGLDATIYPPSRDMKFMNDTPGAILVHSYVDGYAAYFKFFGTKDGREVVLDGPYISNKQSAITEPMLVPDPKLAPGEKKQVEKAHGGFDALWYRTIIKNGETKKEEIKSRYRATQNKFLVGGEIAPAGGANGITPPANPFE